MSMVSSGSSLMERSDESMLSILDLRLCEGAGVPGASQLQGGVVEGYGRLMPGNPNGYSNRLRACEEAVNNRTRRSV
ncbi:MAG: hypothetical protein ACOH1C_08280, partial [Rothia mucilaginosa]|uniref:hypothetical protein n=1 Tax=Rothia mucilaginosa TaxID=43675 RepID=UPI003B5B501E